LRHPDRVAGLVLVATTPGQLGAGETDEQGPPPPPGLAAALRSTPTTNGEFAHLLTAMLPWYLHRLPPEAVEPLLRRSILDVRAWRRSMALLQTWSSVDRLHRIRVPTLLLAGRHDLFCSPAQTQRIARRIPDSRTVILEHSGHLPWLEEAESFFTTIEAWLARTILFDAPTPGVNRR
jgi:proline iminopeptidase